jgi:hypothetical protein
MQSPKYDIQILIDNFYCSLRRPLRKHLVGSADLTWEQPPKTAA